MGERYKLTKGYLGYGPGVVVEYHRDRKVVSIKGSNFPVAPGYVDMNVREGGFVRVDEPVTPPNPEPVFDSEANKPLTPEEIAKFREENAHLMPKKPQGENENE